MADNRVWTLYENWTPQSGQFQPMFSDTSFQKVETFMEGALFVHCRNADLDPSLGITRVTDVRGGLFVLMTGVQGIVLASFQIVREPRGLEEQGDRRTSEIRNSHGHPREGERGERNSMFDSTTARRDTDRSLPADSRHRPINNSSNREPGLVHDYRRPVPERNNTRSANLRSLISNSDNHIRRQFWTRIEDVTVST